MLNIFSRWFEIAKTNPFEEEASGACQHLRARTLRTFNGFRLLECSTAKR